MNVPVPADDLDGIGMPPQHSAPSTRNFAVPPDDLNDVGVLRRREIEARILAPVIEALGREFGESRVAGIVRDVVVDVAREQGRELAERMGSNGLGSFATALSAWKKDGALETELIEHDEERLSFNVTRCRYAELYRTLSIPELGAVLSCNRDFSLVEGFNPAVTLTRTQTIMSGASHCDFRFRLNPEEAEHSTARGA